MKRWIEMNAGRMTLVLLVALACLYPFIAACGASFGAPVLVHLPDDVACSDFMTLMDIWGKLPFATTGESPRRFQDSLQRPEFGLQIIRFVKVRDTFKNVQNIFRFCQEEAMMGGIQTLVVVVSETEIPKDYRKYFAGSIYLDKAGGFADAEVRCFANRLIASTIQLQERLKRRIHEISELEDSGLPVFQALRECMIAAMFEEGLDEEQTRNITELLDRSIDDIDEYWNGCCSPDVYLAAFWQQLVREFEDNGESLPPMSHRLHVEGEALRRIGETVFYDEGLYYFPVMLFKRICESIAMGVETGFVRERLEEAGLLMHEGISRRYWTSKVDLATAYGVPRRQRCVRLNREVLDTLGDFSLMELLEMMRGGANLG